MVYLLVALSETTQGETKMRHGMREYDDMSDVGPYDDMSQFMTQQMLQDQAIAAGAGAGAILLAAWLTPRLPTPKDMSEVNQHRLRAVLAGLAGVLGGRALWDMNRDAAMAIIGGVTGLALAQLLDTFFEANLLGGGYPLGDSGLSAGDAALLAAYGDSAGALAQLETTNVQAARGAFGDSVVTPEALMGTVTQMETLGYNPYLA